MVLIRHTHKYLCARECFISLKLFLFCLPPVEVNHFSTNSHFLSSSFLSPKESQWACLWQSLERRISNLGSSHTWHRSLLFSFLKEIKLLRNLISPRRNKTSILLILKSKKPLQVRTFSQSPWCSRGQPARAESQKTWLLFLTFQLTPSRSRWYLLISPLGFPVYQKREAEFSSVYI